MFVSALPSNDCMSFSMASKNPAVFFRPSMKLDNAGIKVSATTITAASWTFAWPPLAIAFTVSSRAREVNKGYAIKFTPGTKRSANAHFILDSAEASNIFFCSSNVI